MMLKIGDRIINNVRTDDKLPNGFGKGVILMVDNNYHYYIEWDNLHLRSSWAHKQVIELDIEEIRNNILTELGI